MEVPAADELSSGAGYPRGALRWTLAQLRRALAVPDALNEALDGLGLQVTELRTNDYRFLSDRALDACSTYEVVRRRTGPGWPR